MGLQRSLTNSEQEILLPSSAVKCYITKISNKKRKMPANPINSQG